MKIKATIERVPGGLMMVPLACGALLATLTPHIGAFFGSFTNALFTGALPMLAVFYVCLGATISIHSLPVIVKRGGALMAAKVGLGVLCGIVLGHFLGTQPVASGWFGGLSTLAVVASINDTNGGLYMALMRRYGKAHDAAAYSVMALESGPFLTMVTLGVAGLSAFPWQTMLGAILPLCIGILLGNLDPELRSFLGQGAPLMIPFFAFALGTTLDLHLVWEAGLLGIFLGVATLLASAIVLRNLSASEILGQICWPGMRCTNGPRRPRAPHHQHRDDGDGRAALQLRSRRRRWHYDGWRCLSISRRNITLSTAGVVPMIPRAGGESASTSRFPSMR